MPWPCDIGNASGFDPTEDLIAIIDRANTQNRQLVIQLACACALDHAIAPTGINARNHCKWIQLARFHANVNNWAACKEALRHEGTLTLPPATTPATTPWPCDSTSVNCDAARKLFRIIERANSHVPSNATSVIYKACVCARHPKSKSLTEWNTVGKHCDFIDIAWGKAQLDDWNACIDALDHVGGGGTSGDGGGDDDDVVIRTIPIEDLFRDFRRWLRHIHRDPPDRPGGKKKKKSKKRG